MKLKWLYDTYEFVGKDRIKPVAELYSERMGIRVALIVRADDWPETDYNVHLREFRGHFCEWNKTPVKVQGTLLDAQATGMALVKLDDNIF